MHWLWIRSGWGRHVSGVAFVHSSPTCLDAMKVLQEIARTGQALEEPLGCCV